MSVIQTSTINPFSRPPISESFKPRDVKETSVDNVIEESTEITDAEKNEVEELKRRDAEVRTHELAHKAAAGRYARGGANFELERGPDGKFYAVGGHVNLDVGEEADPEDTIRKMETVRRAALAPESPSSQDRSVAAKAIALEAIARRELLQGKRTEEVDESGNSTSLINAENRSGNFQFNNNSPENNLNGADGVFNVLGGSLVDILV